ncbi:hypothetical protein COW46_03070 [Candidatus Gracilibacteria bacterium CG17_big_fil_post_rev_8_21_14_2_50_48_13]|nr:MAG: hypothetical protein COW46_03070 [Candidatus Gracilibacteria bacterium CG17_big_fil_post_rev_8_21_14_2_50_48_13]
MGDNIEKYIADTGPMGGVEGAGSHAEVPKKGLDLSVDQKQELNELIAPIDQGTKESIRALGQDYASLKEFANSLDPNSEKAAERAPSFWSLHGPEVTGENVQNPLNRNA